MAIHPPTTLRTKISGKKMGKKWQKMATRGDPPKNVKKWPKIAKNGQKMPKNGQKSLKKRGQKKG